MSIDLQGLMGTAGRSRAVALRRRASNSSDPSERSAATGAADGIAQRQPRHPSGAELPPALGAPTAHAFECASRNELLS